MLIAETSTMDQAIAPGRTYRSQDELAIRDAVDRWARTKWPDARQVHELVMDRGSVRADMAIIGPTSFAAIEIKSDFDNASRLMNQVAMFRLASPELWLIVTPQYRDDTDLLVYLIPTLGVAHAAREPIHTGPFRIEVVRDAQQFVPHPRALLSLCWVAELHAEAVRRGLWNGKAPTHAKLIGLLSRLDHEQQIEAVCRQLRGRDALWRADPPIAS